jgi:geranylgeranyl diphosphate synthase type II
MTMHSELSPSQGNSEAVIVQRLRQRQELVTRALTRWLADVPPPLALPMQDAVLPDGKRLRPILCLEACEWAGGRREHALLAACAIEMIHKMSLVHDDLPSMDSAVTRNGRPALHVSHGEALAILAGDGLLVEAFNALASTEDVEPARVVRATRRLCRALGSGGVAGGQALDVLAKTKPSEHEAEALVYDRELRQLYARKTGSLFEAAVVVGAELGGANEAQIAAIGCYGLSLGVAFQISDDLLDGAGADAPAVEATNYAQRFGTHRAQRAARELLHEAVTALAAAGGGDVTLLSGIAELVSQRCARAGNTNGARK